MPAMPTCCAGWDCRSEGSQKVDVQFPRSKLFRESASCTLLRSLCTAFQFLEPVLDQQGLVLYATRDLNDHLVLGHDGEDKGYISSVFFDREKGVS